MNDNGTEDKRPDPKTRKYATLWQAYLWYYEMMEMQKRHSLRIDSAEKKKSNYDAQFERDILEAVQIKKHRKAAEKIMISYGSMHPAWEWVTSIKGLAAGGIAAQLLAQIDDINKSPTVAALWRFAGFAVIDGKAEKNQKGQVSKFNRKLKGVCFNIADSFIKQQTPGYIDIYYAEKERQRKLHPDVLCRQCTEAQDEPVKWEDCRKKRKGHTRLYNDNHLHFRAWRKMIKVFLKDLWLEWRQAEGLPISEAYE